MPACTRSKTGNRHGKGNMRNSPTKLKLPLKSTRSRAGSRPGKRVLL